MELSQFDIHYQPHVSIKGQALADFLVECLGISDPTKDQHLELLTWKIYMNGASNEKGAGVRVILISPQGLQIQSTIRFSFPASNNKAEHEAVLVGLRLAK